MDSNIAPHFEYISNIIISSTTCDVKSIVIPMSWTHFDLINSTDKIQASIRFNRVTINDLFIEQ